jgi:hypothetical protein
VLIFEALQPARRDVVLAWRRGLVPLWFSRKPFSHLVVFPGPPADIDDRAGGPSFQCTIPAEGAPSLRFLQEPVLSLPKGWAAMLPAQRLSALDHPLCMPSSYPPFAYAKDGAPADVVASAV